MIRRTLSGTRNAGTQRRAQVGRGDLELRDGLEMDAAGQTCKELLRLHRAALEIQLAQRAAARSVPARPLCDRDVSQVEQLTPLVPIGQVQKRVHPEQQA